MGLAFVGLGLAFEIVCWLVEVGVFKVTVYYQREGVDEKVYHFF
jgi:hypothetical protein